MARQAFPPSRPRTTPRTIPGTPTGFLATETLVNRFRGLMLVALASGALAGSGLFVHRDHTGPPRSAWPPRPLRRMPTRMATPTKTKAGARRTAGSEPRLPPSPPSLAASALRQSCSGRPLSPGKLLNAWHGALWGLAAFVRADLAPALGLPPQHLLQVSPWLTSTNASFGGLAKPTPSAAGLWLLAGRDRNWAFRLAGVICLALPHFIGAPVAHGQNAVPAQLIHQFTIASLGDHRRVLDRTRDGWRADPQPECINLKDSPIAFFNPAASI